MIDAKTAAISLVEKYTQAIWETGDRVSKPMAKACAIIAVEEIMKANIMEYPQHNTIYSPHKNDYWQEVKSAIESM